MPLLMPWKRETVSASICPHKLEKWHSQMRNVTLLSYERVCVSPKSSSINLQNLIPWASLHKSSFGKTFLNFVHPSKTVLAYVALRYILYQRGLRKQELKLTIYAKHEDWHHNFKVRKSFLIKFWKMFIFFSLYELKVGVFTEGLRKFEVLGWKNSGEQYETKSWQATCEVELSKELEKTMNLSLTSTYYRVSAWPFKF